MIKQIGDTLHVTTVEDGVVALCEVVENHANHIAKLERSNKTLGLSVFILMLGGYLCYEFIKCNSKRIKDLEEQVKELKIQNDIPVSE